LPGGGRRSDQVAAKNLVPRAVVRGSWSLAPRLSHDRDTHIRQPWSGLDPATPRFVARAGRGRRSRPPRSRAFFSAGNSLEGRGKPPSSAGRGTSRLSSDVRGSSRHSSNQGERAATSRLSAASCGSATRRRPPPRPAVFPSAPCAGPAGPRANPLRINVVLVSAPCGAVSPRRSRWSTSKLLEPSAGSAALRRARPHFGRPGCPVPPVVCPCVLSPRFVRPAA